MDEPKVLVFDFASIENRILERMVSGAFVHRPSRTLASLLVGLLDGAPTLREHDIIEERSILTRALTKFPDVPDLPLPRFKYRNYSGITYGPFRAKSPAFLEYRRRRLTVQKRQKTARRITRLNRK